MDRLALPRSRSCGPRVSRRTDLAQMGPALYRRLAPSPQEGPMRRFLAGAACLALLALVVSPLASDARKKSNPRLAVATYDGPTITVPALSVTEDNYVVRCPRG